MKVTNIVWDIDENDDVLLPTEIELPEDMTGEDEISDYISDITGFCHKGFTLEEVLFKCNCETEEEFKDMKEYAHSSKTGLSFPDFCIGSRLWLATGFESDVIMVEYHITTQNGRISAENPDEPDWLAAYKVDKIGITNCAILVFEETIEDNIKLAGLKNAMLDFAKACLER